MPTKAPRPPARAYDREEAARTITNKITARLTDLEAAELERLRQALQVPGAPEPPPLVKTLAAAVRAALALLTGADLATVRACLTDPAALAPEKKGPRGPRRPKAA